MINFINTAKAANEIALPAIDFVKVSSAGNLAGIATLVINLLLSVAGALAIIYFIYSGILYITAAGNPDAVKKGQQGLMYSAIGIAVIVLARFIVTAVASYIHVPSS